MNIELILTTESYREFEDQNIDYIDTELLTVHHKDLFYLVNQFSKISSPLETIKEAEDVWLYTNKDYNSIDGDYKIQSLHLVPEQTENIKNLWGEYILKKNKTSFS